MHGNSIELLAVELQTLRKEETIITNIKRETNMASYLHPDNVICDVLIRFQA